MVDSEHVQLLSAKRRGREGFVVKPGAHTLLGRLRAANVHCSASTRREEVERAPHLTGLAPCFQALIER